MNKEDESQPVPIEDNSFPKITKSENQKTYINLIFCELSLGLVMAYSYITLSGSMTIINRLIITYLNLILYFYLFNNFYHQ